MTKDEILEIEGVWTAQEIISIQEWMNGKEGEKEMMSRQILAEKQAKEIQEIAHVNLSELKVPFTFNL